MKGFMIGILLGAAAGVSILYFGEIPHYLPGAAALVLVVGLLIAVEKIESQALTLARSIRRINETVNDISREVREIREVINSLETEPVEEEQQGGGEQAAVVRDEPFPLRDPADDATETFIPQIQVDAAVAAKPHKTQKLDRSVEAVAKKLASVQGQSS